jgi:cellobiose phosphorylase
MKKSFYAYLPDGVTFTSTDAAQLRLIYFPLSGTDSTGLKSCITPFLSGDIKIDKNTYLTKPVSREDLRQNLRDFFVFIKGKGVYSLTQEKNESYAQVEIGQLWHKLVRRHKQVGLELEALNFIPVNGDDVEVMKVTVRNISKKDIHFTPTFALPLFGRGLSNKHDHEHVTALLNRITQMTNGVIVSPTMQFNEEGHKPAHELYFVLGQESNGVEPSGTFPTVESFYGEKGTGLIPHAVLENKKPRLLSDDEMQGKEAMGALRFCDTVLKPGKEKEYVFVFGIADDEKKALKTFAKFNSVKGFAEALEHNKTYWKNKTHAVQFQSNDKQFDAWMKWVGLQPILRRIWGNSFLPDHDYGKGGKGWRDLWQDQLSLILIEPQGVRENLINNFGGIRIDGSNATIIGTHQGEFIADRNAITRVWMDHGVWSLLTTVLYIHQTGDSSILLKEAPYFKDPQMSRTFEKDKTWTPAYGNKLKTRAGSTYCGTILEHILIQHLVQFFNVGEHNITRLESADWNDGLDMAFRRGESVTFMAFYGGNLFLLADLLEELAKNKGMDHMRLAMEVMILLDTLTDDKCDYDSFEKKRKLLFEQYFKSVQPEVSGEHLDVKTADVISDLRKKGQWILNKISRDERISLKVNGKKFSWFNGYYDNKAKRVEGKVDGKIRMTLTGQVFPLMSGLANDDEIKEVIKSVDQFLKDKKLGGFRLNTDFGVPHYLDMGRAFGFAYGTKENGAFFSHMNVMYAYALYRRGYVKEGYEVLKSIYKMCQDGERAKIYPGIPEYFDSEGRGMYPYLTGSASWMVLTELTQVFGVRGEFGDLVIAPKLVAEQFGKDGKVSVSCQFAGRNLQVRYHNPKHLEYGKYAIIKTTLNNKEISLKSASSGEKKINRQALEVSRQNIMDVYLG